MGDFLENTEQVLLLSNILNFAFCFVILVYVRWVLQKKTVSASRRAFKRLVVFVLICLIADMLSYIFDMHPGELFKMMNHMSMFLAVLFTAFVGFLWNDLFDQLFHIKRSAKNRARCRVFWLIPTMLAVIVLIINLFTGIIYNIDSENVYHRGAFYALSFFLQYVSFVTIGSRALLIKKKVGNVPLRRKKMRRTVLCFCTVVIAFGFAQWITSGKIAVHCMGMTAGVVIMFIRFLDNQITQDRLTDLNNRYALDAHMIGCIRSHDSGKSTRKLYLVLMDVDGFKTINDRFGHLEGDNALKQLADALKEVTASHPRGLFVARYGGDEFAAVIEAKKESAIGTFAEQLSAAIDKRSGECEYAISVSLGYCEYKDGMTVSEWVQGADDDLYRNKRDSENKNSI
jgi:diguanylate cyclase (GGDEF)-like protein